MTSDEWKKFWSSLSDAQRQEIRDKARWEHMTLSAVVDCWFRELTTQRDVKRNVQSAWVSLKQQPEDSDAI